MESRSPSDSGGGGGRDGARPPPSPTSPPRAERRNSNHHHHDNERPVPARASRPQPSPSSATMLSLDQIRVVARCSNEYTDGPTVSQKSTDTPPPGRHKVNNAVAPPSPGADDQAAETLEERSHDLLPPSHPGSTTSSTSGDGDENDQAVVRGSSNECSVSSLQRLMGGPHDGGGGGEETVRTQPKRAERDAEERKPLAVVPGAGGGGGGEVKHSKRCGRCGRCSCGECTQRRVLPSCWLCGRRCVCSPQSAVENATCVCCVRGLFYHCSSDDEDTCVDKPFSCTQAHCCTRWTAVALLTLVLPCIACYLPAKTCMAACQHCYDMATRPGCRCKEGPRRGSRTAAAAAATATGHMVRCEAGEKPT